MNVKPIGGNVLVELDPQPEPPTNGIIYLDSVVEKSRVISGKVAVLGSDIIKNDHWYPPVKVGVRVFLSCFVGETTEIDGKKYQLVDAEDLYYYEDK